MDYIERNKCCKREIQAELQQLQCQRRRLKRVISKYPSMLACRDVEAIFGKEYNYDVDIVGNHIWYVYAELTSESAFRIVNEAGADHLKLKMPRNQICDSIVLNKCVAFLSEHQNKKEAFTSLTRIKRYPPNGTLKQVLKFLLIDEHNSIFARDLRLRLK